ncbi:alkaline phosphatase family protein [Clostridia bacterium]|nr:alkaline phosphatase family protein [Clostridia bacterium]
MNKLFVLCVDALCDIDVEYAKTLPNLGRMLAEGSYVRKVKPVYPSFTYPCHVSIMSGVYPDRHGIPHNEMVEPGAVHPPWYRMRSMVKVPYLLDHAKAHGLSTCCLNWPLTAGADFGLNMPMILPMYYEGDALPYYEGNATQELLDRYFRKHYWALSNPHVSLDLFTMGMALDIVEDYGQPDVMFVKLCDLDSARHEFGVDTPQAKRTLQWHDAQFGSLLDCLKRHGDPEHTNFVALGDHGQSDVKYVMNFNYILRENGLQTLGSDGKLDSWDAYCHSVGLSAWIQLRDPNDTELYDRVYDLLLSLKGDPTFAIDYVFTKTEAERDFHLTGPFDFIIESASPVSFGYTPSDPLFVETKPGDYKTALATHGGLPTRSHQTTMFASGPSIRRGTVIDTASLVDEAPTMARMLGFDMPDTDGRVLMEMLRD